MLAGIALMAALGFWQLKRLEWKEGLIAQVEAGTNLPPLTALPETGEAGKNRFRFITLDGSYLAGPRFLFAGRYHNGEVGYHVLAPFEDKASKRVILVNRGWIPAERHGDFATGAREEAQIHGRLTNPPAPLKFGKIENDAGRNLWFYADMPKMEAALGRPIEPVMVERTSSGPSDANHFPVAGSGEIHLRNDHLGYALTWFGIALAGCAILGGWWRRWRVVA